MRRPDTKPSERMAQRAARVSLAEHTNATWDGIPRLDACVEEANQAKVAAALARHGKGAILDAEVRLPVMSRDGAPELSSLVEVLLRPPFETSIRRLLVDVSRLPAP